MLAHLQIRRLPVARFYGRLQIFWLATLSLLLSATLAAAAQTAPRPLPRSTTATATPLFQPTSVAYDAAGNLYFAESRNNVIRRLDTAGNLLTIVGTATQGFAGDGGPASAAELDNPRGVALDSLGNLYIADTRNNRVRRVDVATHVITTIAGTGAAGFSGDGGAATAATLSLPLALALDGQNHLFIADSGNQRIRRIDLSSGLVTTVAGNGQQGFSGDGGAAISASLDTPSGLAADNFGNLFIADTGNRRVREVAAASRNIITLAGDGTSGIRFNRPEGLSLNTTGGLLIADAASHQVYLFDIATGRLAVVAGQGTQAFSGDAGVATLAMLDSPAGIAVGPAGTIAIADTGNQRIRVVTAATPASIVTVAGVGTLLPGVLTLAGASTQAYGSATLTASLASGSAGQLTLLDTTASGTATLVSTALSSSVASLNLSRLPAGTHRLVATWSGDSAHSAAQSSAFQLTVAPLPVTATAQLPSLLYGQPLPSLTGTLTGTLPQDAGAVSVSFSAALPSPAPPGVYPLTAALTGSAAANYQLASLSGTLTVAQAPTTVTLTQVGTSLNLAVASTTSGTPTGAITLLTAAGSQLTGVPLGAGGSVALSTSGLTTGTYTLTAVYTGDTNFLPARSAPVTVTLGAAATTPATQPSSFAFTGSSTAQTVRSGATASFPFAVVTSGTPLSSPITLAVTGLPPFATAAFNPPVISPGGAVSSFTLSVVTAAPSASTARLDTPARPASHLALLSLALLLPLGLTPAARRRLRGSLPTSMALLSVVALALLPLTGCGDRINAATTSASGAAPVTYTITVTGTATNTDGSVLQKSTAVTLTVM